MIVTLTPNPSIDMTFALESMLVPGHVHRLNAAVSVAGGKGINVAHAVLKAGVPTLALFPAQAQDRFVQLMQETGIPFQYCSVDEPVRVNTTLTSPDGTTTKLNGVGATLSAESVAALEAMVVEHAALAQWVVLAGSLPPGAPVDWYSQLVSLIHAYAPDTKVAVDTSDRPFKSLTDNIERSAPDLITPNSMELGQIVGIPGEILELEAVQGNFEPVVAAAQKLVARGVPEVMVTLGSAGAVLVDASAAFVASTSPLDVVSTVGAGDCTLAGYVMGRVRGLSAPDALAYGVGFGSAAVLLPGTMIPCPQQASEHEIELREL
ncbi:1-phosphofructokinase family hexose kinase [Corynebacterium felinum]|uniref:1-phosphofructokinase family hexose kinase n=1 Tax=Corynebacterium felinum TaxID=131318 RepID=UPI0023FA1D1A|nr:1-phosphofructokinase family hexose kinase [Corynebacterium felinum]MDF5821330.1 1-phosphofructokinase family hexose kinase [Corynebacterium felinum]WJY95216.1 Tagatose-6-phosphate kinase [Corynebacterium felinum]